MENGDLNQFLVMRPNANRLGLVRILRATYCVELRGAQSFTSCRMSPRACTTFIPVTWFTGVSWGYVVCIPLSASSPADFVQGCILVDHACRARISEFASATIHLNQDSVRTAGAPHTAPVQWTAPEVLEGKPLTKRADVFSFAMLMVEVSSANAA